MSPLLKALVTWLGFLDLRDMPAREYVLAEELTDDAGRTWSLDIRITPTTEVHAR